MAASLFLSAGRDGIGFAETILTKFRKQALQPKHPTLKTEILAQLSLSKASAVLP